MAVLQDYIIFVAALDFTEPSGADSYIAFA